MSEVRDLSRHRKTEYIMNKIYIGIDNGTSGTIGIVGYSISPIFVHTPIKKEQNYTKAKQNITRLNWRGFSELISQFCDDDIVVVMERPLVNPTRFKATTVALRCFEAQLVLVESLGCRIIYVDSKDWQKEMLPKGTKGEELKKASLDIGNRLFPMFSNFSHPDRDGILIAEYARRKRL